MLPLLAAALHGSCVDESGSPVDWWFLLKHPRWSTSTSKKTHCIGDCKGDTYVWVSSVSSAGWQTGAAPVTSADSLLGKQLAGIYDGTIPNYAFYNDQLPNGSWSEVYGHSKGFLGYTNDSAFWVQHSIPKFPNYKKDGYKYQTGELWYGQHAFCMTLTKEALNEIGSAMSYAYPQVYDHALPDASLPNINAVAAGQHAASGTFSTTVAAKFAQLSLLAKTSAADVDMLDGIVAPALQTAMFGQSWLNSGGPIGGYCPASGGYDVLDALSITLSPEDTHATAVDHSKWAVAQGTSHLKNAPQRMNASAAAGDWWCALDNNHVDSQKTRSGLAVCAQMPGVAALLHAAVAEAGTCGHGPSPPVIGCCKYNDDHCTAGETCCSASGKSYDSKSTCDRYGAKHHCVWHDDDHQCVVESGGISNVQS